MYVITGGAGFIGSACVAKLNALGISEILVVDELGSDEKWKNLRGKRFTEYLHKDAFIEKVRSRSLGFTPTAVVHLGAISSTTERNVDLLMENNYRYTQELALYCVESDIRYLYASSGATYGDGAQGYRDDEKTLDELRPLNPYGYSKQIFDLWVERAGILSKMVGLKFFNVYGPNEYHKQNQHSVVLNAYTQIKNTGKVKLFKSYRPDIADGEQKRDHVYVRDCVDAMWWFLGNPKVGGIFNIGTGSARSFNDLATACFTALEMKPAIEYIEMPEQIRAHYQYFTEADMSKLKATGCPVQFHSLESGVKEYVLQYLKPGNGYL